MQMRAERKSSAEHNLVKNLRYGRLQVYAAGVASIPETRAAGSG